MVLLWVGEGGVTSLTQGSSCPWVVMGSKNNLWGWVIVLGRTAQFRGLEHATQGRIVSMPMWHHIVNSYSHEKLSKVHWLCANMPPKPIWTHVIQLQFVRLTVPWDSLKFKTKGCNQFQGVKPKNLNRFPKFVIETCTHLGFSCTKGNFTAPNMGNNVGGSNPTPIKWGRWGDWAEGGRSTTNVRLGHESTHSCPMASFAKLAMRGGVLGKLRLSQGWCEVKVVIGVRKVLVKIEFWMRVLRLKMVIKEKWHKS